MNFSLKNQSGKSIFLLFIIGAMIFLLAGCSTPKKTKASQKTRKTKAVAAERMKKQFLLRNVWVSDTLSAKNTGFRKINRMSPLVYDHWLGQGNSIDGISLHGSVTCREVWNV
ncbi:MAG: hypothetical protein ACK5P5_10845, partial [Pseudobdellovibrionaceae bacterium]